MKPPSMQPRRSLGWPPSACFERALGPPRRKAIAWGVANESTAPIYFADPRMGALAVDIDSIELDPDNERDHPELNIASIKYSLRRFGWRVPVGVRRDGSLCENGNGTLMAARELVEDAASDDPERRTQATLLFDGAPEEPPDWRLVPMLVFDDDAETAAAWRVTANRTTELGRWKWEGLAKTLGETNVEWTELGWQAAELDMLTTADFSVPDSPPSGGSGDEPEQPQGPEISSGGSPEDRPLILKLEGKHARLMRRLATEAEQKPGELLAYWVEVEGGEA